MVSEKSLKIFSEKIRTFFKVSPEKFLQKKFELLFEQTLKYFEVTLKLLQSYFAETSKFLRIFYEVSC